MGLGGVGGVGGHNPMMNSFNPNLNMPPPPPPGPMMAMPPPGPGPNPPLSGPNPFSGPGMFNPMMRMPMNPQITVGQLGVPPSPPPPTNMQLPPDPKSFQIHKDQTNKPGSANQGQPSQG